MTPTYDEGEHIIWNMITKPNDWIDNTMDHIVQIKGLRMTVQRRQNIIRIMTLLWFLNNMNIDEKLNLKAQT